MQSCGAASGCGDISRSLRCEREQHIIDAIAVDIASGTDAPEGPALAVGPCDDGGGGGVEIILVAVAIEVAEAGGADQGEITKGNPSGGLANGEGRVGLEQLLGCGCIARRGGECSSGGGESGAVGLAAAALGICAGDGELTIATQ